MDTKATSVPWTKQLFVSERNDDKTITLLKIIKITLTMKTHIMKNFQTSHSSVMFT